MPLTPDSRRWQILLGDAEILRLEGVVERLTRCAERLAENADVWREVAIGAFGWAAENQRTIESQRRVIADQREQIRQLFGLSLNDAGGDCQDQIDPENALQNDFPDASISRQDSITATQIGDRPLPSS